VGVVWCKKGNPINGLPFLVKPKQPIYIKTIFIHILACAVSMHQTPMYRFVNSWSKAISFECKTNFILGKLMLRDMFYQFKIGQIIPTYLL
jgi:hypothetical protein